MGALFILIKQLDKEPGSAGSGPTITILVERISKGQGL